MSYSHSQPGSFRYRDAHDTIVHRGREDTTTATATTDYSASPTSSLGDNHISAGPNMAENGNGNDGKWQRRDTAKRKGGRGSSRGVVEEVLRDERELLAPGNVIPGSDPVAGFAAQEELEAAAAKGVRGVESFVWRALWEYVCVSESVGGEEGPVGKWCATRPCVAYCFDVSVVFAPNHLPWLLFLRGVSAPLFNRDPGDARSSACIVAFDLCPYSCACGCSVPLCVCVCACFLPRRNNTGIRLSEYPVALSVPYAAHSKHCNKGTFTALVSPIQWPADERLAPHSNPNTHCLMSPMSSRKSCSSCTGRCPLMRAQSPLLLFWRSFAVVLIMPFFVSRDSPALTLPRAGRS